jgi:hypothetical protein
MVLVGGSSNRLSDVLPRPLDAPEDDLRFFELDASSFFFESAFSTALD